MNISLEDNSMLMHWVTVVASVVWFAGVLSAPVIAAEDPALAGSGYVDPEAIPQRPPVVDVEPVYRPPSIDTLATIRKRGTLLVGVALSEPTVMLDANGEYFGYSVDIARKLAEDIGVDVRFFGTSWSHIIADLLDRQFDVVISGLWATPARALVINYSDPTVTEGVYLIGNRALTEGLQSAEAFDRPDVKIAAYAGSVQERLAKQYFPKAELVQVTGDEPQLSRVLEGTVHAELIPTFAPDLIVAKDPERLSLAISEPVAATFAAIGMRKGDGDFLNYVNTWLALRRAQGWLDSRVTYWATNTDWRN